VSKLVLAALFLFALVGCAATPSGMSDLESAVEDGGYSVTGMFLGWDSFGTQYLELDVEVSDTSTFAEDAERVAKIVWTTFKGDFDQLEIRFNRSLAMRYPYDMLTEMFGERPPVPRPPEPSMLPMTIGIVVVVLLVAGWALFLWHRRKPSPQPSAPAAPLTSEELFPTGPEPGEPFSPEGDVIGR
jgi:hypothetical protein